MKTFLLISIFCILKLIVYADFSDTGRQLTHYLFDEIIITGTTNINSFQLQYHENQSTELTDDSVQNRLHVNIPAKKITSDSKSMLADFLNLINAEKYPLINISISNEILFSIEKEDLLTPLLYLTMNGRTNVYQCVSEIYDGGKNKIWMNGKFSVLLTDFGIEPPRKFWGLIRVKNEVFISFKVLFSTD